MTVINVGASLATIEELPSVTVSYGQIAINEPAAVAETGSHINDEQIVRSYFKDVSIMVQIARCESNFRHTLADGSVLKGRVDNDDTGIMQINQRYHLENAERLNLDLYNIYENMAYARILYNDQGTKPWNSSAPCWRKTLAKR